MSVQTGRSGSLKESEVFHILGNDRRRAIVQLLADDLARLEISAVATQIAADESETEPVPNNRYKSVYVSLQQTHLPQLEEDGVIEYDSSAKTIEPGPNFEDVLQYVNGHDGDHSTVLTVHLALAIFGLGSVAIAGFNLPLVSMLDPVSWSVVLFVAVAASSMYYLLW